MGNVSKAIFIHGNSISEDVWRPLAFNLQNEFNLDFHFVSYPIGFDSTQLWSKEFISAHILKNLPAKFKSDSIVFGHSLGGHLAIDLCEHIRPKALFLLQCSPAKSLAQLSEYFNNNTTTSACMFKGVWDESDLSRVCCELSSPYPVTNEFRALIKSGNVKMRNDLGQSLVSMGLADEWSRLRGLNCPMFLVLSDEDSILNLIKIKADILKNLPELKIIKTSAMGHYGFYYASSKWLQSVQPFLQNL